VIATAEGGRIRFHGTISNRRTAQRLREMAANVPAVREIDMNLEVSADGTRGDRKTLNRLDDLIAALYSDYDLRVSFYKGVAFLEGSVSTLRLKCSVQRFVEQQTAVSRVVDKLGVVT
jgi:osmotically-inducible protein OsmY